MTDPLLSGPVVDGALVPTGAEIPAGMAVLSAIAAIPEKEFERLAATERLGQQRLQHLLHHVLVRDVHYGQVKAKDGSPVFPKPVLLDAGAVAAMNAFRFQMVAIAPDRETIVESPKDGDRGFVSVVVHRALYTLGGVCLATTSAACTSKERRFRKFGTKDGWVFDDAREVLHDLISMAIKRARVRLVRDALGLAPWLSSEEEMEKAIEDAERRDRPIHPWTEEEKQQVYAAAQVKGLKRRALERLVVETLGTAKVGAGQDVERILAAIAAWEPPAPAKKSSSSSSSAEAAPESTQPAAATVVQEDLLRDDQELVEQEEREAARRRAGSEGAAR